MEFVMTTIMKKTLYWTPRILCFLFALFISIFAFDVFEGNTGFWRTTLALLLHLIPTFVILIVLVISWRWEWVGGILFIVIGGLFILTFGGKPWLNYLILTGPLFLMGILFLLNWRYRAQLRAGQ